MKAGRVHSGHAVSVADALVAPRTLAAVPLSAQGRASKGARSSTAAVLVHLDAHRNPGVVLVAGWTPALVAADSVGALVVAAGVDLLGTLVLVHTLVVVEVELETLRASAFVGTSAVAASLLAPGVAITLVKVHAECACAVQAVAARTHALEAAVSVLARARGRTEALGYKKTTISYQNHDQV